ncbi:hypothetical protein D3C71_1433610 [compost metagenome]
MNQYGVRTELDHFPISLFTLFEQTFGAYPIADVMNYGIQQISAEHGYEAGMNLNIRFSSIRNPVTQLKPPICTRFLVPIFKRQG